MTSMLMGRNYCLRRSTHQAPCSSSRSDTLLSLHVPCCMMSLPNGSLGSHLSHQIWIWRPLPMRQINPFSGVSSRALSLAKYRCIAREYSVLEPADRIIASFQYLHTKTVRFGMRHHAWRASSAWLKTLKSRKPKSPPCFCFWIFCHAIQCVFCFSSFNPHRKLRIILLRSSHKDIGSLNTPIMYVGIAWAAAFINRWCRLPARRSQVTQAYIQIWGVSVNGGRIKLRIGLSALNISKWIAFRIAPTNTNSNKI